MDHKAPPPSAFPRPPPPPPPPPLPKRQQLSSETAAGVVRGERGGQSSTLQQRQAGSESGTAGTTINKQQHQPPPPPLTNEQQPHQPTRHGREGLATVHHHQQTIATSVVPTNVKSHSGIKNSSVVTGGIAATNKSMNPIMTTQQTPINIIDNNNSSLLSTTENQFQRATTQTSTTTAPNNNNMRYPTTASSSSQQSQQSQLYSSPYYLADNTTNSTVLKSRNVNATTTSANQQQYQQSNLMSNTQNVVANNNNKNNNNIPSNNNTNNNKSIAILTIPSLLLLFTIEMSSSIPLLVTLCCGLIVYSFDLSNFGSGSSSSSSSGRGERKKGCHYTLIALWTSFLVVCCVVGYDLIFYSEGFIDSNSNSNGVGGNEFYNEEEGEGEDHDGTTTATTMSTKSLFNRIVGPSFLLTKVSISILLLFNTTIWITLQFHWIQQHSMVYQFMERMLVSTLPLISSTMISYGVVLVWGGSSGSGGANYGDSIAILIPYIFALHLTCGILLVGSAPSSSSLGGGQEEQQQQQEQQLDRDDDNDKSKSKKKKKSTLNNKVCTIHPREGRKLSYLLVFLPPIIHFVTFRQRIIYHYASYDDLFDFILIASVSYTLHYLVASNYNSVLDERWRQSLPWVLQVGTSPAEGGERTLRGASVPMIVSLLGSMAFQHRYLVPLCARMSYMINGHDGVISSTLAMTFLTLGTIFAYATVWFFGRKKNSNGEFLMGEYHEDFFQLLLATSSVCFGLSCSPKWTFLPVPMLFAESLALWVITKQLRYAVLTAFVFFTVGTIIVAYRLTFLNESVEIFPGKTMILKKFADMAMYACMYLILMVGLVIRAPGGYASEIMRKYDVTGICLSFYGLLLVIMEFALLSQQMPLYSRDSYEVGRVAVYSPGIAYFTGILTLVIIWHVKSQRLIKEGSTIVSTSIVVGKMLAVLIESSTLDAYNSLGMLYFRWAASSLLLITICAPYLLKPIHVKMSSTHTRRKSRDARAKPSSMQGLPNNASSIVVLYCAVLLPSVIVSSVRLVMEPLVGLFTGQSNSSGGVPKLSEIIGYSASLWGISVLSMINHFLPDGGAEVWRRVSALTFIMGLFVSFTAPAFPGTTSSSSSWDDGSAFQYVSSLDMEDDTATGGWGLVSVFLAILLAMSGPLELREIRESSGRRDTRQLLRLMIFGMMFGCGLSWFITMQSMSKDIFIPIFVTTFSCMAMSTLGTVAAVMGYFLDAREFVEAEQIANIWAGVGFPIFFLISSVSLSAHAHAFGIGGWASTYLSVCGLLSGTFCVMLRLREEKTSTTRGYGNVGCVISWVCAIIVVYGRYGVAGVGVVGGRTSVAGISASVLGTILCSPILLLLEGEGSSGGSRKKQVSSTKTKKKGLVLSTLTRSNRFAPLLAGTILVFLVSTCYAIFMRGCGLSFLFGTSNDMKSQEDVFSRAYGSQKTGIRALDDVATMAKKSVVHTRTMVSAAKLSDSGIWTSSSILGPAMHVVGTLATLPSLHLFFTSWYRKRKDWSLLVILLNLIPLFISRGIPSLTAMATIGLLGGMMQKLS